MGQSSHDKRGADGANGSVVASATAAMCAARFVILVVSPYFIPGRRGLALMRDAIDNGVHIDVLTHSLGATGEPLVHWAYAATGATC